MIKGRLTLILLVLTLLLGGFIFFFERDADSTAEMKASARKAFHMNPEAVEKISIKTDAFKLECCREDRKWMLSEPVQDIADEAKIDRFLYYLDLLRKSTAITAGQREERGLTLDDYGMTHPQAVLTLLLDGKERTYRIGRKATLGDRIYVQEEETDVIVPVDSQLLSVIPVTVSEWRSHELFREDVSAMTRFSMRRDDGFLQLVKQDDGQWMMQQPVKAVASSVAVRQLMDLLNVLQIDAFVTDQVGDPAAYGLENEPQEIALGYRNDDMPRRLLVGSEATAYPGCVYAKWVDRDFVYAVSNVVEQILDLPLDDFRDRKITPMEAGEVRGVMLAKGEQVLEFRRNEDGNWDMLQPYQRPASAVLMDTLVQLWCEAGANEFMADNVTNLDEYGFTLPAARVLFSSSTNRISMQTGEEGEIPSLVEMQLSSIPPTNGLALIRNADGHSIYGVADQLLKTIRMQPLFFRERMILQIDRNQLLNITLVRGDAKQVVSRIDVGSPFQLEGTTEDVVINDEALEAVLRAVSGLQAERFVVENPDELSAFGLAEPQAEIRFGLTGANGIGKTLLIGSSVSGADTTYAMIRGQDAVFELSNILVNMLIDGFSKSLQPESGKQDSLQ